MKYLTLFLLVACVKPGPPTPLPLPEYEICNTEAETRTEDVCTGYFTVEGYACTACKNVSGCVASEIQVYCVRGNCLDERCLPNSFSFTPDKQ